MPIEVLGNILLFASTTLGYTPGSHVSRVLFPQESFALVNRRWHGVATAERNVWTDIFIYPTLTERRLRSWLQLSKDRLLDVTVGAVDECPTDAIDLENVRRCIVVASEDIHRWRSFDLSSRNSYHAICLLGEFQGSGTLRPRRYVSLEVLRVRTLRVLDGLVPSIDGNGEIEAPRLRSAGLHMSSVTWSSQFFRHLTELSFTIAGGPSAPSFDELCSIVREAVHLKRFGLGVTNTATYAQTTPLRTLESASVSDLSLYFPNVPAAIWIVRHLSFPNIENLRLSMTSWTSAQLFPTCFTHADLNVSSLRRLYVSGFHGTYFNSSVDCALHPFKRITVLEIDSVGLLHDFMDNSSQPHAFPVVNPFIRHIRLHGLRYRELRNIITGRGFRGEGCRIEKATFVVEQGQLSIERESEDLEWLQARLELRWEEGGHRNWYS